MKHSPVPHGATSRRNFIRTSAQIGAAMMVPLVLPSRLRGASAPSNRIRVGQIGCGRIARGHDMPGVLDSNLADYVAVCDLDSNRLKAGKQLVDDLNAKNGRTAPTVSMHSNYRELLAVPDLDAVVISTPDHWHAEL